MEDVPEHARDAAPGLARHWPPSGLVITTEDLRLRPVCEADLPLLAERLPADLELDPSAYRFATGDEHLTRGVTVLQQYWHAVGTWTPAGWHLIFAVVTDRADGGGLVGVQGLRAHDFPVLRSVDTWSYLHASARGTGLGTQARRAVLTLAFDELRAVEATSSAWDDNLASRGVSARLGYVANGLRRHRRDGAGLGGDGPGVGVGVMAHARLDRHVWDAGGHSAGVRVEGVAASLPWFGLDAQRLPLT